jgi:hypothetical protein
VGVSHPTVAAVREKLESTAEIPQLNKTTGKDGKKRTTKPRQTVKRKAAAGENRRGGRRVSRGPGKWQAAVLAELDNRPGFVLREHFEARLGRPLTAAEASAAHRAAKQLERQGRCRTVLSRLGQGDGCVTVVGRPDFATLDRLSVERVPGEGTGSTLIKGSLRQVARELKVSVAQLRRDLVDAAKAKAPAAK